MKNHDLPRHGPRAVTEFVYWGEAREMPDRIELPTTLGGLRVQSQRRAA